ncbi:glycosyltransferase [Idiomarina piscisalsi]|uniref:Glycosyltransferase family 1 protein n=1 Tax=Idiomarina piscisalsi TaxID=1096243 RepID=A0A432YR14_9GAMM|nr:glycosyltransferase [Idiomarina piscisalsi]RUO64098.1 hypothetical protein CWI73_09225 [Idiomarina piscisalsi]
MANEYPTPLRILFVAGNKNAAKFLSDPAFIYRCQNPALALSDKGHDVTCIHYKELSQQKNPVDLIIFHRPCFRDLKSRWLLSAELKKRRKQGAMLIADFDDLVFDPAYAEFSPGVINDYVSLEQTYKTFAQHAKTLNYFNVLTVSTLPLKEYADERFDPDRVFWMPNSPHYLWRDKNPTPESSDTFTVCYLPGTRSHDKDFALITEPLADFLTEHPDAQLNITGVLEEERFPKRLKALSKQIQWQEKQPYDNYWQVVNSGHLQLAPLQDTVFNRCKSALKAIEANFFNRPVIASAIPDMQRFTQPGVQLANSSDDWYQQLTTGYLRREQNHCLRKQVLEQYTPEQHAADILTCYQQSLSQ